jgi:hypothetical protein
MAFSTYNLSVSAVCNAYAVANNMNVLTGKTYYTASGAGPYTIYCSPGNTFSLGTLRGAYSQLTILNLADQRRDGENVDRYTAWVGITIDNDGVVGHIAFNNASYKIAGNRLVSLSINFYEGAASRGASYTASNNSTNIYIVADGVTYYSSIGTKTFTLSATSTLTIHAWNQASANLGRQCSQGGSWNYNISSSGLTFTGFT